MHRRRRGFRSSAIRVALGIAAGTAAIFALGIALYAEPTDSGSARTLASRELRVRALEEGERVEQMLPVYRRRVWDYYRATHGLLVATDRRILFIGLPPTIRSRAATGEPPLIEEVAFSYEDVRATVGRVFLRRVHGIVFRTSSGKASFGTTDADPGELESFAGIIAREQELRRLASERERLAREEAARKARAPICHRLRPGDALDLIAARYGTTVELLRQLNGLSGSGIRAGETLLVRAGNAADAGGERCVVLDGARLAEWGFVDPTAAGEAPGAR